MMSSHTCTRGKQDVRAANRCRMAADQFAPLRKAQEELRASCDCGPILHETCLCDSVFMMKQM